MESDKLKKYFQIQKKLEKDREEKKKEKEVLVLRLKKESLKVFEREHDVASYLIHKIKTNPRYLKGIKCMPVVNPVVLSLTPEEFWSVDIEKLCREKFGKGKYWINTNMKWYSKKLKEKARRWSKKLGEFSV